MRNLESQSQQAVITWWGYAHHGLGVPEFLLFAIPNGGGRSVITGAILRREGVRRGVPDLFLAQPSRNYYKGLFIEMKTKVGRVSPEQYLMHGHLIGRGYQVRVCRSSEEAIKTIESYLKP